MYRRLLNGPWTFQQKKADALSHTPMVAARPQTPAAVALVLIDSVRRYCHALAEHCVSFVVAICASWSTGFSVRLHELPTNPTTYMAISSTERGLRHHDHRVGTYSFLPVARDDKGALSSHIGHDINLGLGCCSTRRLLFAPP
jgi:hypothetical protein